MLSFRIALLGLGVALVTAAALFWPREPQEFAFRETGLPPGFRALEAPGLSAPIDPFAGLLPAETAPVAPALEGAALCRALFGAAEGPAGVVPVAVFTDHRCPNCRVFEPILEAVANSDGGVALTVHQWPIFGPPSELSARAALAAEAQGDGRALHRRLLGSGFVATPALIAALAEEAGLDVGALEAAMAGPDVAARLRVTEGLADQFGLRGTPSTVIGGTVAEGALSRRSLEALVALERSGDPWRTCAGG